VINLIVSLPIRRSPSVFLDVPCESIVLWTVTCFCIAKFTALTPLSLPFSHKLLFQFDALKVSSLSNFALKSHNRVFMWYIGN
jgi:hypothetical protein